MRHIHLFGLKRISEAGSDGELIYRLCRCGTIKVIDYAPPTTLKRETKGDR